MKSIKLCLLAILGIFFLNTDLFACTPPPKPHAVDTSICGSGKVTLKANGASRYKWFDSPTDTTVLDTNANYTTPMLSKTDTFYVASTNGSCESARDTVIITINILPNANVGGAKSICFGDSVIVGTGALSGNSYSWTSNPSGFSSAFSNPFVSPKSTTTYTLVETVIATGCSNQNKVTITVNPLPVVSIGKDSAYCYGTGSSSIGPTAMTGMSYLWSSSPSGFSSVFSRVGVNPSVTTRYYLEIKNKATGCKNMDSILLTINPLPIVNLSDTAVCIGTSKIKIGINSISGIGYLWSSNPSGYSSVLSNNIVSPSKTTTYYLALKDSLTGCKNKDSMTLFINDPSAKFSVKDDQCHVHFIATQKYKKCKWEFDDSYIDDTTGYDIWHSYKFEGTYKAKLTVTDSIGCTISDSTNFKCWREAIQELDVNTQKISIHPNPTSGKFNIKNITQISIITISDLSGKQLFAQPLSASNNQSIECNLAKGMYLIEIRSGDKIIRTKLVVE